MISPSIKKLLVVAAHGAAFATIGACAVTTRTEADPDPDGSTADAKDAAIRVDGSGKDAAVPPTDAAPPPRDSSPPPPADAAPPPDASPPTDASPTDASLPDAAIDASPTDAGRDAADAGRDSGAPRCYVEADALALTAATPRLRPGICTAAQLTGAETACLGAASTAASCNAYVAANTACARCVFGALAGDNPATTPVGALIPVSDDSVSPNVASCAALVIGRPDCAVALAKNVVCTSSACNSCLTQADDDACTAAAENGICRGLGDPLCLQAVNAASATWLPLCRGVAFSDTYAKVGAVMCGP